jgi:hypothetical protein
MDFNPSLPQEEIDRELAKDYEAASAEYLSRWRDDITDFVSREIVELAVEPGVIERPFQMGATYFAFVDVAGGSGSDSYALAIGHRHGGRVMIDAVRETRPPFSPRDVTREYASLVAKYRIRTVTGDRYGGDWPGEAWREHGIRYKVSERSKSEIYADLLPLLNGGDLVLLDHARCNAQIASLERRARWGGKSSIDHPMRAHDDVANAVAGCAVHVKSNRAAAREWEQAERPQQVILGYASTKRAAASIPASKPKGRPFTHNDIDPNPPAAPETHFVGNLGQRIVAK